MSGSKQHFGKSTGLACIKERGVASWPFTCFPLHALRLFSCGNKMGGGGGGMTSPGSSQLLAETLVALQQSALR